MWRWDTWLVTYIQPERSDHSFLQLIQTVVYSLPAFPLDEWFPHLWGEKIITMVKWRGGGRRLRAEAWSKRIGRSNPKLNYLSLFFSTGVFSWVVRHIWSSHVSSRFSVRFYVLFSGSRRAFRALGAARPRYLSAAISMWILQLFGGGIFPHTGSYQSRLTGHCLHSITQGPSPGKKKERKKRRRQMSSLTPSCTPLHPVSSSPRNEEHIVLLYTT